MMTTHVFRGSSIHWGCVQNCVHTGASREGVCTFHEIINGTHDPKVLKTMGIKMEIGRGGLEWFPMYGPWQVFQTDQIKVSCRQPDKMTHHTVDKQERKSDKRMYSFVSGFFALSMFSRFLIWLQVLMVCSLSLLSIVPLLQTTISLSIHLWRSLN